jgi:hypothetical protein
MRSIQPIYDLNWIQNEKNKKKRKSRLMYLTMALFFFFYVPSFFYWMYAKEVSLAMIHTGILEDAIHTKGYFIRNERMIRSVSDGMFYPKAQDGHRIQENTTIAWILKPQRKDLVDSLDRQHGKWMAYVYERMSQDGMVLSPLKRIDDEMANRLESLVLDFQQNRLYRLGEFEKNFFMMKQKKWDVINESDFSSDEVLKELKSEVHALTREMERDSSIIKVPVSGLVSNMVVRGENLLTVDHIGELTGEDLIRLENQTPYMISAKEDVKAKDPIFKVIEGNEYYVVFSVPVAEKNFFMDNQRIQIRLDSMEVSLSGQVDHLKEEDPQVVLVVVKMDKGMQQTAGYQSLGIRIIKNTHKGFKIPIESLDSLDEKQNKARIMVLKGGVSRFIEVKVVGKNEDFAIVENINEGMGNKINVYDYYVTHPGRVKEGRFLR